VINDTGTTAHGFEIDLEGLHSSDVTDVFGGPGRGFPTGRGFDPLTSVERYGSPTITEYTNGPIFGVKVTYRGLFDGTSWDFGTPSGTFVTPGDNCWSGGGVGYSATTPCDHFGVGTLITPNKTTYNWLLETSPNSGVLTNAGVNLPAPVAVVTPPPPPPPGQPPAPPQVQMVVQAPAPEVNLEFGDAIWVKVFTTELADPVRLEDLIAGEPVVDQALAEPPEIEWQLLQLDSGSPVGPGNGQLESPDQQVGGDAVLRRYEFYNYSGLYDPETHEALPVNGDSLATSCGDPLQPVVPCDLGYYMGAQNAAVNLNGPAPAVPEPKTYTMLLAGLGLIGFMSRRRKVSAK
jgi:hypothetical protein